MALTGYIDSKAFISFTLAWTSNNPPYYLLRGFLIFMIGLGSYTIATYFLHRHGSDHTLVNLILYFMITTVAVAIFELDFLTSLAKFDQLLIVFAIVLAIILQIRLGV